MGDSEPPNQPSRGFTIVELLVVIVVIGILAAAILVSYTGINQRAIVASLQSDLTTSAQQLKMYYTDNGTYPQSLNGSNCPQGPADARYCLKASSGNTLTYCPSAPYNTFALKDVNANGTNYVTTESNGPAASGSSSAIFTTGGTISSTVCTRMHTFGPSCTSGAPCTITASVGGTITLSISGGGGGGGGGGSTGGAGDDGVGGNLSSVTLNGTTYSANGAGGGGGSGYDGGSSCANGAGGGNGGTTPNGLSGSSGSGSSGGAGVGSAYGGCSGGNGGAGGKVTGTLSVSSGQTVTVVVGSGGVGGSGSCGGGDCGGDGTAGGAGIVTISYPN